MFLNLVSEEGKLGIYSGCHEWGPIPDEGEGKVGLEVLNLLFR